MKVYLLCSRRPIIAEFLLLAESLSATGYLPVLIVPDGLISSLPKDLPSNCESLPTSSETWRSTGMFFYAIYIAFALTRRISAMFRRMRAPFVSDFIDTWEAIARGKIFAEYILQIKKGSTAAVLTADDRDIRFDQGVLAQARRRGVFTLSVAFGKSDPNADYFRRNTPVYQLNSAPWRRMKERLATAYPAGLRMHSETGPLLFFRPGEYWALRIHHTLFPTPWSYGGGTADKVAVIDRQAEKMLRALGVAESKILVAGQCSHDALWSLRTGRDAIRHRLNAKHEFNPQDKLLILALPVFGEHGMVNQQEHIDETEWLFGTLASITGCNVLISLHPRQIRSEYERIASSFNVEIADAPLRDVLAAADLFVAYSSTINWAQLLGIPSIALEYYGLGYELFDNEPGVLAVRSRGSLAEACNGILNENATFTKLLDELAILGASVPFDGQVRQRLITEINLHSRKD